MWAKLHLKTFCFLIFLPFWLIAPTPFLPFFVAALYLCLSLPQANNWGLFKTVWYPSSEGRIVSFGKQYYVFLQFSRWIRPGAFFVVPSDPTVLAAIRPCTPSAPRAIVVILGKALAQVPLSPPSPTKCKQSTHLWCSFITANGN